MLYNYKRIIILGAGGILGREITKAAVKTKTDGAKWEILAVSDYHGTKLNDCKFLTRDQAIQDSWNIDDLVINSAGSSIDWDIRTVEQIKREEEFHEFMWNKAKTSSCKWVQISSGICAPISEGVAIEKIGEIGDPSSYKGSRSIWENRALELNDAVIIRAFALLGWGVPYRNQWAAWNLAENMFQTGVCKALNPNLMRSWTHPQDAGECILTLAQKENGISHILTETASLGDLSDAINASWSGKITHKLPARPALVSSQKALNLNLISRNDWSEKINSFVKWSKLLLSSYI